MKKVLKNLGSPQKIRKNQQFLNEDASEASIRVLQYSAIFRNISQCSAIFRNIPQYSAIFHNILQYSAIFQISENSQLKENKKMDFKIMCDSDDKNAKNPGNIPELL